MKIEELAGMQIWESDGHGKTVKGAKKTSSIQVREYIGPSGYLLLKTINYPIGNKEKRNAAIQKARDYIIESTE